MKRIFYTRPDGGLSIITPCIGIDEKITEDEALERSKKDIPIDATDVQIVEETAVPADRTFRDAWVSCVGGCRVDMPKARNVHRNRLRMLRAPLLAKLDVDYMKAQERGDAATAAAIAKKKQALRDVTVDPAIDAAATPEALAAVMPAALEQA